MAAVKGTYLAECAEYLCVVSVVNVSSLVTASRINSDHQRFQIQSDGVGGLWRVLYGNEVFRTWVSLIGQ